MNISHLPVTQPVAPAPRALRLGFLSPHNAHDRRAFSGTAFFAARALDALPGVTLRRLGAQRKPGVLARALGRPSPRTKARDCDFEGLDIVVGMVATGLLDHLARTQPDLPFLHVTDATPAFLRDVYGWAVPAAADAAERRVAMRAAACVYSSDYMASRAARDLDWPGIAAHAQPFGVNFETLPDSVPVKPRGGPVNLLFIGLDWVRKGGDVAVAALDRLIASGQDARLTIIGRCPENLRAHPSIQHLGFLNKNRSKDAAQLSRALREAHLLLLPSRADCTPMVVAEAMAHGTPVIATETGGIAGMIADTGRVLPALSPPGLWAESVREMTATRTAYEMVSDAAFDRARASLSWQSWAQGVVRLAEWTLDGQAREIAQPA